MLQSCGVADLIATCFGGRNARCAAEFVRRLKARQQETDGDGDGDGHQEEKQEEEDDGGSADGHGEGSEEVRGRLEELWRAVEAELLRGQKLEGVATCREVVHCLRAYGCLDQVQFPLVGRIHRIAFDGAPLDTLFSWE